MNTFTNIFLSAVLCLSLLACGGEETPADRAASGTNAEATEAVTVPPERGIPVPGPNADVVKEDENATGPIADIRDEYTRIQNALRADMLRKEMTEFECENDPGTGQLVRYYEEDELVLMDYLVAGEHYWEKQRIYLSGGSPFFVFEEEGTWSFGGPPSEDEMASNTVDKITENRYYLQAGEVIRQLTKSFEDRSWEDSPQSEEVPNETVDVPAGTEYPKAAAIPQMMEANVGC